MKIAVISDIHSNLEALQVVRREIEKEKVERIYCLGDTVGYNANPSECLEMIREMGAVSVAGNHDFAAVGMTSAEDFNPYARVAASWAAKQLNPEEKKFIEALPLVRKLPEVTLVHATLHEPENWGYVFTAHDAADCFEYQETPICFIGHSHLPSVFEEGGEVIYSPEAEVKLDPEKRYIINAGSVGQPRDGNPKSCFVIYDTEKSTVQFRRVSYDIAKTQQKVLAAGLPPFLAERLAVGR